MPYSYPVPDGYIPVLDAASQLAFGDPDFRKQLKRVEIWLETGLSRSAFSEAAREKIDECGRYKSTDWVCPELSPWLERVHELATTQKVIIIARRRAVQHWVRASTHPPINDRFEPISADYLRFNDWVYVSMDPYPLSPKNGDPFGAEWFYPAIALQDLNRLRQKSRERRGRPERVFWETAGDVARKWLEDNGYPISGDGGQAKLERYIADWLMDNGHEAGDRTIRNHVIKWIGAFRTERGA